MSIPVWRQHSGDRQKWFSYNKATRLLLFSSRQHTHQILLLMLCRVKLVLQGVWEGQGCSGRVLALHYCQQLGLSLWPFYGNSSDHNDARWLHCDWIVQKHIKSRKQSAFRTHYRPDCISNFWMFTNTVQYRTLPQTKLDIWINLPLKFNAGRTN